MRHEDWSCRFLEGNRNVCVVSATLVVFGIDRQGKIDAVHTIVLVDDQACRAGWKRKMVVLRHYFNLCMYEETSPGWQNTACMTTSTWSQPWTSPSCWSNGHGWVAGVMDMAELLESWTWPSCWSCWVSGRRNWNGASEGRKGLLSPGLRHVELQISGRVNWKWRKDFPNSEVYFIDMVYYRR